jgi:hypothetical protein
LSIVKPICDAHRLDMPIDPIEAAVLAAHDAAALRGGSKADAYLAAVYRYQKLHPSASRYDAGHAATEIVTRHRISLTEDCELKEFLAGMT